MPSLILKVLYIAHISSKYTGSNRSMLNMLAGLISKGISPIVVMPPMEDMSLKEELAKLDIETHIVQYYPPIYQQTKSLKDKLLYYPKLIKHKLVNRVAEKRILELAKINNVGIVHTNVGPLLLGNHSAKILGVPHVWHLREFQDLDFNMDTWYSKMQFKAMVREPNNYPIAISRAVFDYFELQPPAEVIYNGIMKSFEKQFIENKEPYFLFVGYLAENKGIVALLNAFQTFSEINKAHKLLVAGSTGDVMFMKHLRDLVIKKGIEDRVEFLGHRDDIFSLMTKATALIVPSFNEAFGRITAEAMFNGCLVIGKNAGGTKEIIEKIGLGLLYDTEEELVRSMEAVVSNGIDSYYDALKEATEKAVVHFSQEKNADYVYQYYQKILSKD